LQAVLGNASPPQGGTTNLLVCGNASLPPIPTSGKPLSPSSPSVAVRRWHHLCSVRFRHTSRRSGVRAISSSLVSSFRLTASFVELQRPCTIGLWAGLEYVPGESDRHVRTPSPSRRHPPRHGQAGRHGPETRTCTVSSRHGAEASRFSQARGQEG